MRHPFSSRPVLAAVATTAAAALFARAPLARAAPVNSIQFQDGNVLNVVGSVGTGGNAAYEVFDFPNGTDVAYQYNFTGTTDGWSMLNAVDQADPNLTVTAPYYASFGEHYVTDINYAALAQNHDDWDFYTGTYSAGSVSPANPQGTTFAFGNTGIDLETITNGEFVAWVDVYPNPPAAVLPETAASSLPEPATGSLLIGGVACLLGQRRRSRR